MVARAAAAVLDADFGVRKFREHLHGLDFGSTDVGGRNDSEAAAPLRKSLEVIVEAAYR